FLLQAADGIRCFHVTVVRTCAIPILTVTRDDRETVEVTTQAIYEGLHQQLSLRQDELEVPDATRVHLEVLSPPEVKEIPGERMKPLLALIALGTGSAVGLAVLGEGIVGRRRRRAAAAEALAADETEQDLTWDWSELDAGAVGESVPAGGRRSSLDDGRGER